MPTNISHLEISTQQHPDFQKDKFKESVIAWMTSEPRSAEEIQAQLSKHISSPQKAILFLDTILHSSHLKHEPETLDHLDHLDTGTIQALSQQLELLTFLRSAKRSKRFQAQYGKQTTSIENLVRRVRFERGLSKRKTDAYVANYESSTTRLRKLIDRFYREQKEVIVQELTPERLHTFQLRLERILHLLTNLINSNTSIDTKTLDRSIHNDLMDTMNGVRDGLEYSKKTSRIKNSYDALLTAESGIQHILVEYYKLLEAEFDRAKTLLEEKTTVLENRFADLYRGKEFLYLSITPDLEYAEKIVESQSVASALYSALERVGIPVPELTPELSNAHSAIQQETLLHPTKLANVKRAAKQIRKDAPAVWQKTQRVTTI